MNDLNKLNSKLEKKIEQVNKLENEIKEIQTKIQEEKDATIIKTLRKVNLSTSEYENLSRGIQDKTVIEFLETKYKEQTVLAINVNTEPNINEDKKGDEI